MKTKPSVLLKDVDFDFEESEDSLGPHIALTFSIQGGAASGYNKPLLFKSEELSVTPELINKLKEAGEDTINLEKAMYNSNLRRMLDDKLREKEFVDRWDYAWIEDFNDTSVIFYTDKGIYIVGYTATDTSVTLEDIASPVIRITDYVDVDGDILVSGEIRDQLQEELDNSILGMLNKSFDELPEKYLEIVKQNVSEKEPKTPEEKDSVIKSEDVKSEDNTTSGVIIKNKGDPKVDLKEILKSEEAQALLKGLIAEETAKHQIEKAELQKSLDAEKSRVDSLIKAEEVRIEKAYTEVVKSFEFVAEDKVQGLVKALVADGEGAGLIMEVLKNAAAQLEDVKAQFAVEKGADIKSETKTTPHDNVLKAAAALKANKTK